MNRELVEKVTQIVIEKLNQKETDYSSDRHTTAEVKFWNHLKPECKVKKGPAESCSKRESHDVGQSTLIKLSNLYNSQHHMKENKPTTCPLKSEKKDTCLAEGIENPLHPEELEQLKKKTPARIGIGRAGLRPKTKSWLSFRYDHAAAVDTVYGEVNYDLLKKLNLFSVETLVKDKEEYIRRPDLGRKLSEEAKQVILQKCVKNPTVQIIISDGLSSNAINENLEDVYLSLEQSLKNLGLDIGTPFFIHKGRVAIMDEVGELLQPKVVVLLIGERPGLVSAESLSAYLCYEPRIGTIEADRMVISNIHKGGIPPVEAGASIGSVVEKILKYEASGINLIKKEQ